MSFMRIIVATDGSELTDKRAPAAVEAAVSLAKVTGGTLHAVTVKQPFPQAGLAEMHGRMPVVPQVWFDMQEETARARVAKAVDAAHKAGVAADGMTATSMAPWVAILDACKANKCDAIVMASHGRKGLASILLGSETQKVLTHANVPVLVVK